MAPASSLDIRQGTSESFVRTSDRTDYLFATWCHRVSLWRQAISYNRVREMEVTAKGENGRNTNHHSSLPSEYRLEISICTERTILVRDPSAVKGVSSLVSQPTCMWITNHTYIAWSLSTAALNTPVCSCFRTILPLRLPYVWNICNYPSRAVLECDGRLIMGRGIFPYTYFLFTPSKNGLEPKKHV